MKVVTISTKEATQERFDQARAQGFVTFVYRHADPLDTMLIDKFLRVSSDEELNEKIELLKADAISYYQVRSL